MKSNSISYLVRYSTDDNGIKFSEEVFDNLGEAIECFKFKNQLGYQVSISTNK